MMKLDDTVKKETIYILCFTIVLSVLMQAVFLIIGHWNLTVLLGNLLGAAAAVANFFLMALTIQFALGKEEKEIANRMKFSQSLRLFMLFAVALIGHLAPCFHLVSVVLPYLFPRIAVMMRGAFFKR